MTPTQIEYMKYAARMMTLVNGRTGPTVPTEMNQLAQYMERVAESAPDEIAVLDKSPTTVVLWVLAGYGQIPFVPELEV